MCSLIVICLNLFYIILCLEHDSCPYKKWPRTRTYLWWIVEPHKRQEIFSKSHNENANIS
ncbi:unnamed protein product, partial [Arabidopsis halleri]